MPNPKRFTSNAVTTVAYGVAIVIMLFFSMVAITTKERLQSEVAEHALRLFIARCMFALAMAVIFATCISLIKVLFKKIGWDHQQRTVKQLVMRTLNFFLIAGAASVLYFYYYLYYVVLP